MGDRALFVCKDRYGISPAVYIHWGGHEAFEMVKEAAPFMRAGDRAYAIARLCGVIHSNDPGSPLSLGIYDGPPSLKEDDLKEFSQGDAGVIVIDVDTGKVKAHAGYLAKEPEFTVELCHR